MVSMEGKNVTPAERSSGHCRLSAVLCDPGWSRCYLINHVVFDIYQIIFHNVLLFLDLVVFHNKQAVSCVARFLLMYHMHHPHLRPT